MSNLTDQTPSDKSQPSRLRALAVRVIDQSLSELACVCPYDTVADAAYMLARESALRLSGCVGPKEAAMRLYRIADEFAGIARV